MRFFKNKFFKGIALVAVITLVLGIISNFKNNAVTNLLNTLSTPVQSLFSAALRPINEHFTTMDEMKGYKAENERLIKEITKLKIENRDSQSYIKENNRLKNLLDLRDKQVNMKTVAANTVARDYEQWYKSITLNKGTSSGIEAGNPVITNDGVVGVVESVGCNWARVTTIYDTESTVGAKFTRTGDVGVVEGSYEFAKDGKCKMQYISGEASVIKGDILVTSGLGEVYPSGLMIGKIDDIKIDAMGNIEYASVKPAVDFDKVYEVLVITEYTEEEVTEEENDREKEDEEKSENGDKDEQKKHN